MFYWLYELQGANPGIFRLFGSPVFRAMAALATALVTCLVLYPWLIRQLQLKQIGQVVRDDGPESHFAKRGTPTMGGTLLVISVVGACLLWCNLAHADHHGRVRHRRLPRRLHEAAPQELRRAQ